MTVLSAKEFLSRHNQAPKAPIVDLPAYLKLLKKYIGGQMEYAAIGESLMRGQIKSIVIQDNQFKINFRWTAGCPIHWTPPRHGKGTGQKNQWTKVSSDHFMLNPRHYPRIDRKDRGLTMVGDMEIVEFIPKGHRNILAKKSVAGLHK